MHVLCRLDRILLLLSVSTCFDCKMTHHIVLYHSHSEMEIRLCDRGLVVMLLVKCVILLVCVLMHGIFVKIECYKR